MIILKPVTSYKKGTISDILKLSYQDLISSFPNLKMELYARWEQEDQDAYDNPVISDHVLFSCLNDTVIGYFSWDDRKYPTGIIGQNCIIPSQRNRGYGKRQIEAIEEKFRLSGFREISVLTGNHSFFYPAHRMYLSSGFKTGKITNGPMFEIIEFNKQISQK
jgi:GNAT superfamily N-acetyltransferase